MLSPEMKQLIVSHTAGMVGTVDDAGKPAVSPKATFFIVDDETIAYGDIRSPGTRRNIAKRPAVEVNFIDVVYRKAVRVTGTATFIAKSDADVTLLEKFSAEWPNLVSVVSGFVKIKIHAAQMIVSPAYDRGATAEELRVANLAKLNAL
jgi:predicted pyridoxine 5'-phosphate oxidase superfamily flavin-nucleotide-binding protein